MNKNLRVVVSIVLIALGSFGFLSFVDNDFEFGKNLDIFASLFRELTIYYVDETDPGQLIESGIDGMLESLDPYTTFIPESEMEDHRFAITGQYGGIGSLIRKRGNQVLVAEPYEGFPAEKAGLRAGDIILKVDGKEINGKNTSEVSKVLKGQPGTVVKLLIKREGREKPFEAVITREEIKIKSVPHYGILEDGIGYIKLNNFTSKALVEVKAALNKLRDEHELNGLIFDLRGNPGGLLRESVNIVNLFVEKGEEIVSTRGKLQSLAKVHRAINAPVDTQVPLVVLVNRNSASASEIVSGAIQDLDRGVIVGQKTFGKGLVQQTVKLTYNTQLKVTTAKYYIPSGRCIQALDYTNRNSDGSVGKIPDSLMTEFKTKNGRSVFDGGGIEPGVKTERPKRSNIAARLLSRMLIFDYANKYRREHDTISSARDFKLKDEDYEDFVSFLKDKEYDYATGSERKLKELKEIAEKEKYFEDAKGEYEALEKKLTHSNEEDLIKFKDEIVRLLEGEIAVRYYFQQGRIEAALMDDIEVLKGLEVLKDEAWYASILEGTYESKALEKEKE
ncbi:MAG TPA: S41 family peptidase [Flavobacteriales bacterium]|nr:S41 family peptidase [Flavobacteriales bacterium]